MRLPARFLADSLNLSLEADLPLMRYLDLGETGERSRTGIGGNDPDGM